MSILDFLLSQRIVSAVGLFCCCRRLYNPANNQDDKSLDKSSRLWWIYVKQKCRREKCGNFPLLFVLTWHFQFLQNNFSYRQIADLAYQLCQLNLEVCVRFHILLPG